ncbi:choice-of-anchor L domain-containing protein, partial [Tenacibaculum ascidiaceicola]|uniref:choice-of-anchor L domain-containing protein n=1 Tax=Tenacibaculum ascidiaceicola TaxID=1699411 RepID=UPI0039EB2DCF
MGENYIKRGKNAFAVFLAVFLSFTSFEVLAQASVTQSPTASQIATELQSVGVIITNPVITHGNGAQMALFTNGVNGASLEVDRGIAFTTSNNVSSTDGIFNVNSNTGYSSGNYGTYNDADLRELNVDANQDVVIFEFDFEALPNYTGVLLEYQFGSEEYPDYVGSYFNDVFGFFVSDPNNLDPSIPEGVDSNNNGAYNGTEEPALNLAQVPSTTNPVAVNFVNAGFRGFSNSGYAVDLTKSSLYINNGHVLDNDSDPNNDGPQNTNPGPFPVHVEFNGITKRFTTNINLTPGITYHMKIAIADVGDYLYDSGVFITRVGGVPIIIADNDEGQVVSTTGGVAVANVLVNDSVAGSTNPSVSDVQLVQVSTDNPGITLNTSTGEVNVAPGVASGVYELVYNVCEPSTNCDSAIVIVTVLEDTDGDGIADEVDLDDDNDGILDVNEGLCTPSQSGSWTVSGTTATYDYGNGVIARVTTTDADSFTNDSFNNQSFWSETLGGDTSLAGTFDFGTNLTVSFENSLGNPVEVKNPTIHLDRIGGLLGSGEQYSALVTLQGGLTWSKLAGTSDFSVTSNTVTDGGAGVTGSGWGGDSTANDVDGTAAGSLKIYGTISTFTLSFSQNYGGSEDGIELILFACENLDTDFDGTPNYLDTDSDDDGCYDALEGAGSYNYTQLSSGAFTGGVDSNGIPTVTSGGQATVAAVTDASDSTACCTASVSGFLDTDGDNIVNDCDLDDDNDGILDTDEKCAGGVFNPTSVSSTDSDFNSPNNGASSTGSLNNTIDGDLTTRFADSAPDDGVYSDVTYTFPETNTSKLRIYNNGGSNLGDNQAINTIGEIKFYNSSNILLGTLTNVTVPNGDSGGNPFDIDAFYTGVTKIEFLNLTGLSSGIEWRDIQIVDDTADIDKDGQTDCLDTDSDGDGCFDAIEGDENVGISDLLDGRITGGVDSDGVPDLVTSGSADIGGDQGQGNTTAVVTSAQIVINTDLAVNTPLCAGETANFTFTATGSDGSGIGWTYQLQKQNGSNWDSIGSSGTLVNNTSETKTVTITNVQVSGSGTYRVLFTHPNNSCEQVSQSVSLTVNELPTPIDTPLTICPSETSTDLTVNDSTVLDGETGTVTWYDGEPGNGGTAIASPTTANLNTITDLWAQVSLSSNGCTANVDITTNNDTTNPTASNPTAVNVQCSSDVPAADTSVVTDEADNCGVP